jgi:hypothetical protein
VYAIALEPHRRDTLLSHTENTLKRTLAVRADKVEEYGPMILAIRLTVAGIGTATPDTAYTKTQILDLFDIKDRRTALLFRNSGVVDDS